MNPEIIWNTIMLPGYGDFSQRSEPEIGSSPEFENHWHRWQLPVSPSSANDLLLIYREHSHLHFVQVNGKRCIKRNHLCCCIHLNSEFIRFCTSVGMFNTSRVCSNLWWCSQLSKDTLFFIDMYSTMNEITSIRSSGSLIVFSSSTCIPSSFNCQKISTDEMLPKMSIILVFIHSGETSDRENQRV